MMLAELRRHGVPAPSLLLTMTTVLAGLFGTLVLVSLNTAMQRGAPSSAMLMAFVASLVCFYIAQTQSLKGATRYTEAVVRGFRSRLLAKLCSSKLRVVEQISADAVFGVIERETKLISHVGLSLVAAAQSCAIVLFCLLYLLRVSTHTALLVGCLAVALVVLFVRKTRRAAASFHGASQVENQLFELVRHVVYGFKEIKLNGARRASLLRALDQRLVDIERLRVTGEEDASTSLVISRTALFLVVGLIVCLFPLFQEPGVLSAATLATTVLFMAGPMTNVSNMIPVFARARASFRLLAHLDEQLAAADETEHPEDAGARFTSLEMRDVSYAYCPGVASTFTVGPLSVSIEAGTAVFITGENGSGKSTFLRLLTGLYQPTTGQVLLNGERMSSTTGAAYRNRFAAVFWDYHLFDRFYGLNVQKEEVDGLLAHVDLQDKVAAKDDGLSTLDLSTGQRRRLALVTALLEDRELCVLDEWAADQDPARKHWFYHQEIPRLLSQGKTVVISTHDKDYFHLCHQELRFENGACTAVRRSPSPARALAPSKSEHAVEAPVTCPVT